jgi:hypothetical protein
MEKNNFDLQNSISTQKPEAGVAFEFVRLTVCVSRKWAGRDSAREPEKTQSQKKA